MEISINNQNSNIEIIKQEGNKFQISLNGKTLDLDITKVEKGIYSILIDGKSYEMEVVPGRNKKNYIIGYHGLSYDIEIIDSEAKYLGNKQNTEEDDDQNSISSPMPGKVIKIPIEVGEKVKPGQTLIIISAMKMESEYKAKRAGVVKEIFAKEGENIEGNQSLILID
ncbi:MAG: biotin/lipoyl-binding protein [Bacteroidales bacterium]|nr:biotin/lipoyl-binding protein [Bacteroidales bacterium]